MAASRKQYLLEGDSARGLRGCLGGKRRPESTNTNSFARTKYGLDMMYKVSSDILANMSGVCGGRSGISYRKLGVL
jgi:hypothetical protein